MREKQILGSLGTPRHLSVNLTFSLARCLWVPLSIFLAVSTHNLLKAKAYAAHQR